MKIKPGYKIRDIAGEHVIVSVGQLHVNLTRIISLNDTSVWLWQQLEGKTFDAEAVAFLLVAHYVVERPTALRDAEAWIASLRKADLLED